MSYKTLLVHLDEHPRRAARLQLALDLASRFDAHVVGLFAMERSHIPSWAVAEASGVFEEIEVRRRQDAERAAADEFEDARRRWGTRTDWRVSREDPLVAVRHHALYADLVVAGQPELEDAVGHGVAAEMVLSAGRPVLFVPYAGRLPVAGKRVLVAWRESREAARAVTDALPLLERAETVDVVTFNPSEGGDAARPAADLARFLSRQGVKATAARQRVPDVDVGSQILSRAADTSADLVVMGGYGHSRLRELVLGGATRTLLKTMTVPVLMSH